MFKKDLIQRKISLIQDDLTKLAKLSGFTMEEVSADFMKQATVERLLERIISRAIDVNEHIITELGDIETEPPKDYKATFHLLSKMDIYPKEFGESISKSVGTRNILVHEYDKIDPRIVYASISDCLKDYHQYCDYILKFLEKE